MFTFEARSNVKVGDRVNDPMGRVGIVVQINTVDVVDKTGDWENEGFDADDIVALIRYPSGRTSYFPIEYGTKITTAILPSEEFLTRLNTIRANKPWQKFKRTETRRNTITAYHGGIPREFRHPDEWFGDDDYHEYTSEYEIPGYKDFERWEAEVDRITHAMSRKYPKITFTTAARR